METIIKIENLSKKVSNLTILSKISLSINRGEKVAILGANGSGKTTLVEIITGIVKQSGGTVQVISNAMKHNLFGMQFQEGYWPKGVTPKSVVKYYTGAKRFKDKDIQDLIDIFEIRKYLTKDINNLSGGEKQGLNAMLSVVNSPDILILDELGNGLDLRRQFKLVDYFVKYFEMNPEKTLIMISHNPEDVEKLCERLVLLSNGMIFKDLNIEQVIQESKSVRNYMEQFYNSYSVNKVDF